MSVYDATSVSININNIDINMFECSRGCAYTNVLTHLGGYRKVSSGQRCMEYDVMSRTYSTSPLYTTNSGVGEQPGTTSSVGSQEFFEANKNKTTSKQVRRIGGRRKKLRRNYQHASRTTLLSTIQNSLDSIRNSYGKVILWIASASLLWVFLINRLFAPNPSMPSYVYYQSSVVERQMIKGDGNVERTRTETFKSNLPDLVRQQQKRIEQNSKDKGDTAIILPQSAINDMKVRQNVDEQILRSLDALINSERKLLLDDFL
jgi:hypothetical protein